MSLSPQLNDRALLALNRPHQILHAILDVYRMRELSRRSQLISPDLRTSHAFAQDNAKVQIMLEAIRMCKAYFAAYVRSNLPHEYSDTQWDRWCSCCIIPVTIWL